MFNQRSGYEFVDFVKLIPGTPASEKFGLSNAISNQMPKMRNFILDLSIWQALGKVSSGAACHNEELWVDFDNQCVAIERSCNQTYLSFSESKEK